MEKTCLIISGGEFVNLPEEILRADKVIACDMGLDHADRYGILTDMVVGDFDSVSPANKERILNDEVAYIRYPKEKDDTDTMIAMRLALEEGYRDIRMVCVFGKRMDHTFSNIQTACYGAKAGALVRMYDKDTEVLVFSNRTITITGVEGDSLSVFSLTDESRGVTIKGTKYELEDAVLSNSFPLGQSNEFGDDTALVGVKEGILMVIK